MTRMLTSCFALILVVAPARLHSGEGNRSVLIATSSSQAIQNARANAFHLSRMHDIAMIEQFHRAGLLVRVPSRTRFYYLHRIPAPYRYLRPWTKLFLDRLSGEFYARFRHPLRVTSLIRTTRSQARLERRNGNAADATGPDRSSHLTGATLDISKRLMPSAGKRWMRQVLVSLEQEGYLYAVEEFQQPTFHVMVYPTYREYVTRLSSSSSSDEDAD